MVYKISFYRNLFSLKYVILTLLGLLIYKASTIYFGFKEQILYYISLSIFFIIPTLVLHVRYLISDYKKSIKIDFIESKIYYKSKSFDKIIEFKEIRKIEARGRFIDGDLGLDWFAWSPYFYLDIFLTSGEKFKITSLSINSPRALPFTLEFKNKTYPWC